MPDGSIRLAHAGDADCLLSCFKGFAELLDGRLPPDAQVRDAILRLIADPGTDFFVAEDSSRACAGMLQQRYRYSAWTLAEEATIEDVFVHEAYRGRGLGRDLVAFALDTARARGATRCVLDTNEVNATAIALYESMGFTCVRAYGADRGRHLFYAKDLS